MPLLTASASTPDTGEIGLVLAVEPEAERVGSDDKRISGGFEISSVSP
jgi:hypothetical protein